MRRVVVTGMGIVCPLGVGVEHVWRRLINGESGIAAIQSFDTTELPAKIAGQVPAGCAAEGGLDLAEWIPVKEHQEDGPLHPSRHGRRRRGGGGFRLGARDRGREMRAPA